MTDFLANHRLRGIVIPNLIGNRNASTLRLASLSTAWFPLARE